MDGLALGWGLEASDGSLSGPYDFTPFVAIAAAVLIARFVVGWHLTPVTAMVAIASGAT